MNETFDSDTTETDEDERGLDPRDAARLLVQTQRRAQRELDFRSPWLSLLAAAAALVAFGAVWLSVRAQHPYKGPTVVGLLGLYAVVGGGRAGSPPWCTPIAARRPASVGAR